MNTFLEVIPQQTGQATASNIRMNKRTPSSTSQQFEKYKQNLLINRGQSLHDFCVANGLSYEALRHYARANHISVRNLKRESLSDSLSDSVNTAKVVEVPQQIHVVVHVRKASFDVTGITAEQLSAMIERMASHV